jgi:hypothetical protein
MVLTVEERMIQAQLRHVRLQQFDFCWLMIIHYLLGCLKWLEELNCYFLVVVVLIHA